MSRINLALQWNEPQKAIFFDNFQPGARVIAHCGRRLGKTRGAAQRCITWMLEGVQSINWNDVSWSKVSEYWKKYFMPVLDQLPRQWWTYDSSRQVLKLGGSELTFHTASNTKTWSGSSYQIVIFNEPREYLTSYLFDEVVGPMLFDYDDTTMYVIGTAGGINGAFYRLHQRAVVDRAPGYIDLQFSSYANCRDRGGFISRKQLDEYVATVPHLIRRQEIDGDFISMDGVLILETWLVKKDIDSFPGDLQVVLGVDVASGKETGAYHAITALGRDKLGCLYCLASRRGKWSFKELQSNIKALSDAYGPTVIGVEDRGIQSWLIQELRRNYPELAAKVRGVTIESKAEGLYPIGIMMEKGQMVYNNKLSVDFFDELLTFPNCDFKDQVDSLSLGYAALSQIGRVPYRVVNR